MNSNHNVSVIIPINNEVENVSELYGRLCAALKPLGVRYELIFIDDFSSDNTQEVIHALSLKDPNIFYVRLNKRSGQTAAILRGLQEARYDVIVTMDGDLQCDPAYIRGMLGKLGEGFDVVLGRRISREDSIVIRAFSYVGNLICRSILRTPLQDISTPYRAFKRNVFSCQQQLHRGHHRFLPIFFNTEAVFYEMPIRYRKRVRGKSHYSINKAFECLANVIALLSSMGKENHRSGKGLIAK